MEILLLAALALFALLLDRVGYYGPIRNRKRALDFETIVLLTAEEHDWEERMQRLSRQLPERQRMPLVHFKVGSS